MKGHQEGASVRALEDVKIGYFSRLPCICGGEVSRYRADLPDWQVPTMRLLPYPSFLERPWPTGAHGEKTASRSHVGPGTEFRKRFPFGTPVGHDTSPESRPSVTALRRGQQQHALHATLLEQGRQSCPSEANNLVMIRVGLILPLSVHCFSSSLK